MSKCLACNGTGIIYLLSGHPRKCPECRGAEAIEVTTATNRGEKSPQSDSDRKALSRARETDALDWFAEKRNYEDFAELKAAIKEAYARAMGFDNWSEFCRADDPERWKK